MITKAILQFCVLLKKMHSLYMSILRALMSIWNSDLQLLNIIFKASILFFPSLSYSSGCPAHASHPTQQPWQWFRGWTEPSQVPPTFKSHSIASCGQSDIAHSFRTCQLPTVNRTTCKGCSFSFNEISLVSLCILCDTGYNFVMGIAVGTLNSTAPGFILLFSLLGLQSCACI